VTFDVTTFGARNDGTTDNTAAFRRAIDVCNAAGGGTVLVPPGTYLTGAIRLRSNVNLRLAGATLMFSGDESRYPVVLTRYEGIECMNRSPMIYAYGERNIGLTGDGTLDAAATASWNKGSDRAWLETQVSKPPQQRVVPGSGHAMRSAFVEPYNCRNVLIQSVTLRNSMFWQIHPTLCRNVTVDGVSTDPSTAHNNTDGRRVDVSCQNIVVFGCQMNGNWGAITCGSEQTGGIRNVYAYRNTLVGATKFALYVKSNTQRGGYSQNINLDNFAGRVNRAYAYVTMTYNGQTGSYPPAFGRSRSPTPRRRARHGCST
jgi:polygalacturonase